MFFRWEDWLHRILGSCYYLHFVLYYFSILVIKLTEFLLYLTQAEKLIVAYLALHYLTRNIPGSGYLWLNFAKIELLC